MAGSVLWIRGNEHQNRPGLRQVYNGRTVITPCSRVGFFHLRLLTRISLRHAESLTHRTTRLACSARTLKVHQLSPQVPQSSDLQPATLEKWQFRIGNCLGGISYYVQVAFGAQDYTIIRGTASIKKEEPLLFSCRAIAFYYI